MDTPRTLTVTAVQANPLLIGEPLEHFKEQAQTILEQHPKTELLVFPELHLFGDGNPDQARRSALEAAAEALDGPRVQALKAIAAELGIWLVPGSVCERGANGELFNTQLVLSPQGELVASYRKIFPWRPHEPYDIGDTFVTAKAANTTLGLHICYDSWFPETTRHLAWMGAEIILNVVKTTSEDRAQELILARANAIVNQVFFVSVNVAAPTGKGHSMIVAPDGDVIASARGEGPEVLSATLDLDALRHIRDHGTAGVNRPWAQFRDTDPVVPLPLYQGRIDPATWNIEPDEPGKTTDSEANPS
ncbi:carbon-nitrogen hydrolase family protein [Corynebacterium pseudopelargi]|uniref:2-oxoglutaramate amidase n=1 Tax=Corynebacterium pseudopelargi TaxID=2080757 RepID=A0A3G6IVT3_9CORY|nr:carbon-nitrogen hydrolase family protein [Corynebacterium pseudopelargi]AZA08778.1 2-oxoglutaramate amidase [Corynebacterium pseudopelargi]